MYKSKLADIPLDEQEIGFNDFIRNLEVPKFSNEEQASLKDDLTLEGKKCLSFEENKTPGEDGFSKEFYESFFHLSKQDSVNSYNEAFQRGSL